MTNDAVYCGVTQGDGPSSCPSMPGKSGPRALVCCVGAVLLLPTPTITRTTHTTTSRAGEQNTHQTRPRGALLGESKGVGQKAWACGT